MDLFALNIMDAVKNGTLERKTKTSAPKKEKPVSKKEEGMSEPVEQELVFADLTTQPGTILVIFHSYRADHLVREALHQVDATGTATQWCNQERGYFVLRMRQDVNFGELRRVFYKMDCGGTFLNVHQIREYEQTIRSRKRLLTSVQRRPNESKTLRLLGDERYLSMRDEDILQSSLYGKMVESERDYHCVETQALSTNTRETRKGEVTYQYYSVDGTHSPVTPVRMTEKECIDESM